MEKILIKKLFIISICIILLNISIINVSSIKINSTTLHQSQIIDEYDMVIVVPSQFSSNIQPLIDHKNNIGIKTFFKSTEEIYSNYQGNDKPEQIKYFIKDNVEKCKIRYVLLIGDINLVPIRKSTMINYPYIDDIITDLYYSDMYETNGNFSSWDSNNNGIYGEFEFGKKDASRDIIDLYPDVIVGRLPCSNSKEVSVVVDKIISYENRISKDSWFKRLILMAGDSFPGDVWIEGEIISDIVGNHMKIFGFEPIKLYASEDKFKPMILNQEISKGAGFVCFSGHGYPQAIATSKPNETKRISYYSPYMIGIRNNNKLPIFFLQACSTATLDFTVQELSELYSLPFAYILCILSDVKYKTENIYPCFAWELIKKPNGGGIASIGATRLAFGDPLVITPDQGIELLNLLFFKSYKENITLGQQFTDSIISFINYTNGSDPITPQEFILIGDPSLKIGGYSLG